MAIRQGQHSYDDVLALANHGNLTEQEWNNFREGLYGIIPSSVQLEAVEAALKAHESNQQWVKDGIPGSVSKVKIPLPSALSGISSIFQANIWIRVAEVAIGLVLVAVGLAKMTNAVPAATKLAKMVA